MPREQEPAWSRAIPIALILGIPIYFALFYLAALPCWGHCGAGLASLPFRLIAYLPTQFPVHTTLPPLADAILTLGGLVAMVVTAYPVVVIGVVIRDWRHAEKTR